MPIWEMPPVSEQPAIQLIRWTVVRFKTENLQADFVYGWDVDNACGRTSSVISDVDLDALSVRTRSGRIYRLCGQAVLEVGSDDAVGVAGDRCGQHMNVIRIWKRQPGSDRTPIRFQHLPVGNRLSHIVPSTHKLANEIGPPLFQITDPLVLDEGRPLGCEQAGNRHAHQSIGDANGIEHARIQDCGVACVPRH